MKNFFLKTIIALVFVVVLDGLFLLFKDIRTCPDSVLAALAGLNISYLSLFLVPLCAPGQRGTKILSDTLYLIGTIYFIFEFIVGVTFLFGEQDSMVLPVVIQTVMFALYIIVLLSNVLANDATRKSVDILNAESDNIRAMADEADCVRQLLGSDETAYRLITKLYDELKASPVKSTPETADIEREMSTSLMLMRDYAGSRDIPEVVNTVNRIRMLVSRRNSKLKNIRYY